MPFSIKMNLSDIHRRITENQIGKPRNYDPLYEEIVRRVRNEYLEEILTTLRGVRYRGEWEPRTESYASQREHLGLPPKYCDIEETLRDSLIYYRKVNIYYIDIDPRFYYPGSLVLFSKVCRWLEYGLTDSYARPLLVPAKRKVEKRISSIIESALNHIAEGVESYVRDDDRY